MGADTNESFFAPMYITGTTTSTFDLAWELSRKYELPAWSSVLAAAQTSGRGQLRREWISPPGNLYASFFLPLESSRLGDMASIAVGYCIREALHGMGIPTLLKWPNDLLLCEREQPQGKLCGLLLEEREGRLLAGLGLNCRTAPGKDVLRKDTAVSAIALPAFDTPLCLFWKNLLTRIQETYGLQIKNASPETIRQLAEGCLAWKGLPVQTDDAEITGTVAGLATDASLLLETRTGLIAISSGSISPV